MGLAGLAGAVQINEIRIDQPSTDNDEYFELKGSPGESLDGLTYLVIGDGTGGSGVIEAVVDLTGLSIPGSGYFVAAEGTFSLGTPDLVTSLNFENSDNVTHLLVDGFSGSNGDDLDTNDDGVLDVTPWTSIVDEVAVIEETYSPGNPPTGTEWGYGPTVVGPDGSLAPGQVYRCEDGPSAGSWQIGDFTLGVTDTPGAMNTSCVAPPPAINFLTRTPCVPDGNVDCDVTINTANATSATLFYSVNGGGSTPIVMTTSDNITYSGTIPGTAYVDGDVVSYYVTIVNANPDTLDSYERGFFAGPSTVNIGDLHVNDVDGRNIYESYGVHIQGVTTSPYGLFSTTNTDYYIQDATGGINVFQFGAHSVQPNLGDVVEIWGSLDQYNGKLEITTGDCDTLDVELVGPGVVPTPLDVDCQNLNEDVEGMLVKTRVIIPADFLGTTTPSANISYGMQASGCEGNSLFLDVDAGLGGILLDSQVLDVVGVAAQYDFTAPYDTGYEIVPRYTSDITVVAHPLAVRDENNGAFRLMQNMPNPVTSATQIRFAIPPAAAGNAGTPVRLDILDLQGRLVKTVVDRNMPEGKYEVSLGSAEIGNLSNGIYFYRLTAGSQKKTMKLMILR